ncbi:MAG: hypothetical protein AAGI46_14200 [Planctomycetota bacterium]
MRRRHHHHRRRGLGIAELLVALAISAAVLGAIAAATHAGFQSYQTNAAAGDTAQRSRLALGRALDLLRGTDDLADELGIAHDPGPITPSVRADFIAGDTVEDDGFVVYEPYTLSDGTTTFRTIVWQFDADSGEVRQSIDAGDEYVVLRNVTSFRCRFQPMRSSENRRRGILEHDRLRRATVVVTVEADQGAGVNANAAGRSSFTLSGSASPRRNVGV